MKIRISILVLFSFSLFINSNLMSQNVIYSFNNDTNLKGWEVVNDDVMGGVSSATLSKNTKGNGVFKGVISLENNGGFSSIRYYFNRIIINDNTSIRIKLKGDGKKYQFRIKANKRDYYSYIMPFETSGEWETINIKLKDMYPSFRGRELNMKKFNNDYFEQVTFLIGNKRDEKFQLLIDELILEQ